MTIKVESHIEVSDNDILEAFGSELTENGKDYSASSFIDILESYYNEGNSTTFITEDSAEELVKRLKVLLTNVIEKL